MKERPILFSAPMVRAILEGHKMQTRRVVKPQPLRVSREKDDGRVYFAEPGMRGVLAALPENCCAHGAPGDRLWVRETWGKMGDCPSCRSRGIAYRATQPDACGPCPRCDAAFRWRPSIFMPRSASRITLEVTAVRVEHLQDISRGDAMEEGCPFPNMARGDNPRRWYANLWDSINGPGSWQANPFVWVIEFKRLPHDTPR